MRIYSRTDLKLFCRADRRANGILSLTNLYISSILNKENVIVCYYLNALRHEEYHINNSGFIHKILYYYWRTKKQRIGLKYGLRIGANMVGQGLRIPHISGGVIINCKSMGCNCSVNGGVVVGNKDSAENLAIIGDNCKLSIGSKVIGKITIGNNVIVAPNAVVIRDVPSDCIVGGVPSKILKNSNG